MHRCIERIYGVNCFYSGHAPADLVELETMHRKILAGYKIMKDMEREADEELRAAKEELQVLRAANEELQQSLDALQLAATKRQLEPVDRPQDAYPSPKDKSSELFAVTTPFAPAASVAVTNPFAASVDVANLFAPAASVAVSDSFAPLPTSFNDFDPDFYFPA